MEKSRRLHFRKNTRKFCFDALTNFCPVSGKDFHLKRIFLEKHSLGHRTSANCFCSDCAALLYKESKVSVNKGMPIFIGKSV